MGELIKMDETRHEELMSLRRYLGISDEDRFERAVKFVELCLDGEKKNKAYMQAFECDKGHADRNASSLHRSKWVQEIFKFMRPEDNSLYIGEIKQIIAEGMRIINDPLESARNKTEAMRALQPYIKAEKAEEQAGIEKEKGTGESMSAKLQEQIDQLAAAGKMVTPEGEIIDVDVIE
jgi:hypothetical protein